MSRPPKSLDPEKGARIRFARLYPRGRGGKFTLQELGEKLGKHYMTVNTWEKGRIISDSDLLAIATITGHDFEWLKTGKGQDPRQGSGRELTPARIREIRQASDMTQQMFADTIGISVGTLQNWEAGRTSPKGSQAESILEMDMTIGEVIEDAGKPTTFGIPEFTIDQAFLEGFQAYLRSLSPAEFEQLKEALFGIMKLMRGENVPNAIGYAFILSGHLQKARERR